MTIRILPPDEAAKKAKERVAEWKRQREMDAAKARIEAKKPAPVVDKAIEKVKPRPAKKEITKPDPQDKDALLSGLIKAARKGDMMKALELIESGADFNASFESGETPLMSAALNGQTGTATLLIASGADVNATEILGETALMCASVKGHTETAEMLISHGADTCIRDKNGKTALKWALDGGHTETADMLISHGATE